MTQQRSLFKELFERRLPQIIGMYIAAVWLAVEIGDWMSERFDVPAQFSSYVFVIMISFLPLVALLAWGHGRPGKDKWTQKQIMFIPFNIILAYFAVNTFIKPTVQATEIMSLVDEQTGQVIEYEVPKKAHHQKVVGFFWENKTGDEDLDWLSYAGMWLVAQDLMRSPLITLQTPYHSASILSSIRKRGFDDAIGEPLSLDLSIAGDKDAQWLIKGNIVKEGEQVGFEVSLYDVVTGALVRTITTTSDDWLFALDDVAKNLGDMILSQVNAEKPLIPDISIAEHVSQNLTAIKQVISAMNSVSFENNYQQGIDYLNQALNTDNGLAEAYVLLIDYYRMIGNFEAAKQAAQEALKLEYKLYDESLFKVKANYYAVIGEQDKAIKVLENWVKVYPESTEAFQALGFNYMYIGNHLDQALEVFEKLYELQEAGSKSLMAMAKIYRLKGDKDKAIAILEQYHTLNRDRSEPLVAMAETYMQFGDLDAAKEKYDEASLLSFNDVEAELGLALILGMQGELKQAIDQLDDLVAKAETDEEKVKVLTVKETLLFMTGQLMTAMQTIEEMRVISQSYMAPLAQTMMFGSKKAAYLSLLGMADEAWSAFEQLKANTQPPFNRMLSMQEHVLYELQGNHEKADEALAKLELFLQEFQLSIYDQFIYSSKAKQQRKLGDFEKAIELHDKAINESKQSILTLESLHIVDEFLYEKAVTLTAMKAFEPALKILNENLQRNPINGVNLLQKAKILMAMDQLDEAQANLNQLQDLWADADPEYKYVRELQELVSQLQSMN